MNQKIFAVLIAVLFVVPAAAIGGSVGRAQSAATTEVQGFQVLSTSWGTPTANAQPGPGDQSVPLLVSFEYLYPFSAVSSEFQIGLPAGFTSAQGGSNATVYDASRLSSGQIYQLQTYLDLSKSVTLGKYTFPVTISWLAILSNSSSAPEVSLAQSTIFNVTINGDARLVYSASYVALNPGEVNYVPITLLNIGTGTVSNVATTIALGSSQSVSALNSFPLVPTLAAGANHTYTLQFYVSSNGAGAPVSLSFQTTYLDPYDNGQSSSQTIGLYVTSSPTKSSVAYSVAQSSLVPGQVNNVTLILSNTGQQALDSVQTTISTSAASASVLAQPSSVQSLNPGASVSLPMSLFVSSSAANTPVTLSLSTNYLLPGSGIQQSFSSTLGLYVSSASSSTSNASVSVSELANRLSAGNASPVSFLIKNSGTIAIYSPTFSIAVSQPLVVGSNSSYMLPRGSNIPPNGSFVYEATILTSPTATLGAYAGTLTVTYSNSYGISTSQSFQVGFELAGTIEIVIQNEQITTGSGNLTVSGTILNEGTAPAYYASARGSTNSSSSRGITEPSSYIGEIDPNTPVPFSTTVAYSLGRSQASSSIPLLVSLVITYKDSFGTSLSAKIDEPTAISSSSSIGISGGTTAGGTPTATGQRLVLLVFYAVIIGVVAAVVAGMIIVRRRRKVERIGEAAQDAKVV